jgi:hypothetical protein
MQTESDAELRITRIMAGLLLLQIARIRRRTDLGPESTCDDFSVGYVFGFVDVMSERVGVASWEDAYRIFVVLAKALFGHQSAETFCTRLVDRQHSPETIWGASTGRRDSRSWLRDPTIPPVGWYQYFCSGPVESAIAP